ncbi:hypothetical protein C1645_783409 [Glomus cerebriforme]|uniref:Uncharacterized protein n=1 Tax=Glomus cerebriforme TaxID=658196 RepID=A0A397SQ23_9GLOM|nr:hypothetical protein C1645_783409 [Glomus cerebriforme]
MFHFFPTSTFIFFLPRKIFFVILRFTRRLIFFISFIFFFHSRFTLSIPVILLIIDLLHIYIDANYLDL